MKILTMNKTKLFLMLAVATSQTVYAQSPSSDLNNLTTAGAHNQTEAALALQTSLQQWQQDTSQHNLDKVIHILKLSTQQGLPLSLTSEMVQVLKSLPSDDKIVFATELNNYALQIRNPDLFCYSAWMQDKQCDLGLPQADIAVEPVEPVQEVTNSTPVTEQTVGPDLIRKVQLHVGLRGKNADGTNGPDTRAAIQEFLTARKHSGMNLEVLNQEEAKIILDLKEVTVPTPPTPVKEQRPAKEVLKIVITDNKGIRTAPKKEKVTVTVPFEFKPTIRGENIPWGNYTKVTAQATVNAVYVLDEKTVEPKLSRDITAKKTQTGFAVEIPLTHTANGKNHSFETVKSVTVNQNSIKFTK